MITLGTNVHVILEQYKPATSLDGGEQINGTTPHGICNGSSHDTSEANNIDGNAATQTPGYSESPTRRVFVFSANDKVALETQMRDIGTSLYRGRGKPCWNLTHKTYSIIY